MMTDDDSTGFDLESPSESAWVEDGSLCAVVEVEREEGRPAVARVARLSGSPEDLEHGRRRLTGRDDASFKAYVAELLRATGIDVRVRRMPATRSLSPLWVRAEQGFHRPSLPKTLGLLRPTDRVLDLGANTGGFASSVAPVVESVLGVEPDPVNASMWRVNCADLGNCRLLVGAAVGEEHDGSLVELWLSDNRFCNTVFRRRGRSRSFLVPAVRVAPLLEGVTVLKCDVEGAEYGLGLLPLLGGVRVLALEFHRGGIPDWSERLHEHVAMLELMGFSMYRDPRPPKFNSCFDGLWAREL